MIDKIIQLTKRLYPSGRAFRLPVDSTFLKLHEGLAESENRAFNSSLELLNQILPDNDNFTEDDATAWEIKLALAVSPGTLLEDRKEAIIRKMRHPGNILPRQHYLYVQKQLQDAGFNVFVHENKFATNLSSYATFGGNVDDYKIASDDLYAYVTNTTNNNIAVYDINTLALDGTIGTSGSGDGQFNNPTGIYVYGDFIYVLDNGNNRVQIFDRTTRNFFAKFGTLGSGDGQINLPKGISADNDFIYIADTGNNRVQLFNIHSWNFIGKIDTGLSAPEGIDIKGTTIYVADTGNKRIKLYNKNTLAFITEIGTTGSGDGQFNEPVDISINAEDYYVLDRTNEIISSFKLLDNTFTENNDGLGLTTPNGLVVGGNFIYVVDNAATRIQVLNKTNGLEVVSVVINPDPNAQLYTEHADITEHALETEHGASGDIIASGVVINSLNQDDEIIGSQTDVSLRSTWFISGAEFPAQVNVPAEREREFRNLILTLKPVHTYAYLMVNYI